MQYNAKKRELYNASATSTRNDEPYMNRVHTLRGDGKSVRQMYQSDKHDEQRQWGREDAFKSCEIPRMLGTPKKKVVIATDHSKNLRMQQWY
jgi:hypothetical protein